MWLLKGCTDVWSLLLVHALFHLLAPQPSCTDRIARTTRGELSGQSVVEVVNTSYDLDKVISSLNIAGEGLETVLSRTCFKALESNLIRITRGSRSRVTFF